MRALAAVQTRINNLTAVLRTPSQSSTRRDAVESELRDLGQSRAKLLTSLAASAARQLSLEKDLKVAQADGNGGSGASGYPACKDSYYGILFDCGSFKCGKADPEYRSICEVWAPLKAEDGGSGAESIAGVPSCSTTSYGEVFACADQSCGKRDADYQELCVLAPDSQRST